MSSVDEDDRPKSSSTPPPFAGRDAAIASTPSTSDAPHLPPPSSTTGTLSSPTVTSPPTTPAAYGVDASIFSPGGSRLPTRVSSPYTGVSQNGPAQLVSQAFAPHVAVQSSHDCEELMRHKGLNGGLLELLRPFGENIAARVVIRDSTGAGRAWDDFAIRFVAVKDGLEAPRMSRSSVGSYDGASAQIGDEYRPARIRSGGDISQIEQLVERHLDSQPESTPSDEASNPNDSSAFALYERKLLSGTLLTPHESFAHPVALVVAISSRNSAPIEELRNLYADSNTGASRLPPWVNNEFLRYYVLVHDEDYDDIKKSAALYEQMKRHFGLHCHLLRIRSTACPPDEHGASTLPEKVWTSAAEDLVDLADREEDNVIDNSNVRIYESDANAIQSFVREMVTQSIIPSMERSVATWNDQVASRRRGLSGRFMSLSKRFTPFGSRSNSPATTSGSNYDSSAGFYRTDAPEALMRKLADYATMLRDYKLAHSTYELLCGDFKTDKAWRHYAGANEMAALTLLMSTKNPRLDALNTWLENAYYSYFSRCAAPFHATRAVVLCASFLHAREGLALDDAARWLTRLLDDRVVGPVGHALILERIGDCYTRRRGAGALSLGSRRRKAAFWTTLAARAWLDMDKPKQAGPCLERAAELYETEDGQGFEGITAYLAQLDDALQGKPLIEEEVTEIEEVQLVAETVDQRPRRASLIAPAAATFDPLGAVPLSAVPAERTEADGFR